MISIDRPAFDVRPTWMWTSCFLKLQREFRHLEYYQSSLSLGISFLLTICIRNSWCRYKTDLCFCLMLWTLNYLRQFRNTMTLDAMCTIFTHWSTQLIQMNCNAHYWQIYYNTPSRNVVFTCDVPCTGKLLLLFTNLKGAKSIVL